MVLPSKVGSIKQAYSTQLVRTRTDIKLRPSRLEYYHDQSVKQLVRTQGLISSCGQVNAVLPILFVSSYSYIIKLEQIHMQLLLNYHLAAL